MNWSPIDDDDVVARSQDRRARFVQHQARLAEQQAAEAERHRLVREKLAPGLAALAAIGVHNPKITIHPHGTLYVPGRQRQAAPIDVTPKVHEIRFWNGFEPCDESLRWAVQRMIGTYGSFDSICGQLSGETVRRWDAVTRGLRASARPERNLWITLAQRGVTALTSELIYRLGQKKSV